MPPGTNDAISQLDQVTQQNAANAEESASASEELSAQSEQLSNMVGDLATMVGGASRRKNSLQKGVSKATGHPAIKLHEVPTRNSKPDAGMSDWADHQEVSNF